MLVMKLVMGVFDAADVAFDNDDAAAPAWLADSVPW